MKKISRFFQQTFYVASPFFVALYAVLFLYVQNQHEYKLGVLSVPLLVSFMFTLIVCGIARIIFKNYAQSSVVSASVVFICLSYGRFLELGKGLTFKIESVKVEPEVIVGISVSLIFALILYGVIRFKNRLVALNKIILIVFLVLVSFQVINIVTFEAESGRVGRKEETEIIQRSTKNINPADPDIYYFIFDRYAGPKSSTEQYGFDNSAFFEGLEKKGFYVSTDSSTNYPKTFLSLGSSLNMEYLDFLTTLTNGGASKDESIVTPLIENSKVLKFLKDRGYTYVNIGSWWEPTKKNKNAEYSYYPRFEEHWGADEFTTGFYNTTIARPVLDAFLQDPMNVSKDPHNNSHRQAALYQFEVLEEIPKIKSPKFVFVHVLLPHDPFVFDKNCRPISEVEVKKHTHQVNYINQLQCVNIKINKIMDDILKNSKNPPVIVLQSDEGPFPMNVDIPEKQGWGRAKTTSLKEKFPILNAYYFPGGRTDGLYQTITPVNTFRVLFNTYFGTTHELLPDKNYVFKDDSHYFQFIDVTEKLK